MPTVARHEIGTKVGIGLAAGPIAWFATQQATYYLASKACGFVDPWVMLAVDILGLAVALGGAWLCWRQWRMATRAPEGRGRAEHAFAAGLGLLLCGLFALAIVHQGLATFFFSGCEQ